MKNLIHLPLEPYKARYTEQLHKWEAEAFSKTFNVTTLLGEEPSAEGAPINVGEVLDAFRRPIHALHQTASALGLMAQSPENPLIYCSDFFHPGIESFRYCRRSPVIASFLWAQTFDIYDFTNSYRPWMRPWEEMAFEIYDYVFVASPLLHEAIIGALRPDLARKVKVVGLPFNPASVQAQLPSIPAERTIDVIFTSRFDVEKQPMFFLNLVDSCPELKFAVCTGRAELTGTDQAAVKFAHALQKEGKLQIFTNCSKAEYYTHLASSKVQFNCSLQDWVSFTLLEALTFGCYPVYPMFRDFVSNVFAEFPQFMYAPGVLDDAPERIFHWTSTVPGDISHAQYEVFRERTLSQHSRTLDSITSILNEH